jgi:hypothetical protein
LKTGIRTPRGDGFDETLTDQATRSLDDHPRRSPTAAAKDANVKKVAGVERRYGSYEGRSSEGCNPMSARAFAPSGEKVATEREGASRQEGEKP